VALAFVEELNWDPDCAHDVFRSVVVGDGESLAELGSRRSEKFRVLKNEPSEKY
jgi:hypothetical protein